MIDRATHGGSRASTRRISFASVDKLALLVWAIPCCLAAIYLVVFLARFSHNIWLTGWVSDYAFGFLAPQSLVSTGIGGGTNLGTYGSYVPLWFGLLTAWMPLHRELWQVAPSALFCGAALLVGWSVAQLASRLAGALAVLLALVLPPTAWAIFMAPAAHNMTYPCTALLGAYLIWLTRGEGRRRASAILVPLLLALLLGTSFASDNLLVPAAILPLFLTGLLGLARRSRRALIVGLSALTTAVAALPVAWLTSTTMKSLGYETEVQQLKTTQLSELSTHLRVLYAGLKQLFNGYLGPEAPGFMHGEVGVASDVVLLLALATLALVGLRAAAKLVLPLRPSGVTQPAAKLARSLHIVYWVASAAGVCGAYALSEFSDAYHTSFYATTILSIAAIVPLYARERIVGRWLVPLGVTIFFAGSLIGIADYYVGPLKTLLAGDESAILRLARANHVTVGYTGYWGASSLTWNSHERVQVRPIHWCPEAEGQLICRFPHDTVGSWYTPKPRHTFLIVEPNELASTSITVLPRGLGRPLAAYALGPVRIYVYPYDIAAKVGPPFGALEPYYKAKEL